MRVQGRQSIAWHQLRRTGAQVLGRGLASWSSHSLGWPGLESNAIEALGFSMRTWAEVKLVVFLLLLGGDVIGRGPLSTLKAGCSPGLSPGL